MTLVFFIPESPRFLMAQGKEDEARAFLIKYRELDPIPSVWRAFLLTLECCVDGNGDPNSALVHLEIQEMIEGIRLDGIDKRWWDCQFTTSTLLLFFFALAKWGTSRPS